jgi:hypothetical protein
MQFATPSTRQLEVPLFEPSPLPLQASGSPGTAIVVTIAPTQLSRAVLSRVLSALAARAHFSTDRLADTQLLADALAAHARGTLQARPISVAVEVEPRDLHLQFGPLGPPLPPGRIAGSSIDGLGPTIAELTDAHRVMSIGDRQEALSLHLLDRGR